MPVLVVSCNTCDKPVGKVDEARIAPQGGFTRCPKCQNRLFVQKKPLQGTPTSLRVVPQQEPRFTPPTLHQVGPSPSTKTVVKASSLRSHLLIVLLVVVSGLLLLPPPTGLSVEAFRAGVLTLFAIGFWATGALPAHLTALIFFLLAMLFAVAPPDVVFSGFHSTALWLIFGGLVIGIAIKRTGLGVRLAHALVGMVGTSYLTLLSSLVLTGIVFTFVMPSSVGRVLLLTPVVLALADRLGFTAGSPGRAGMVMAAALGTHMPAAAVLPAAIPNLILVGAAQTLYGIPFKYGSYLMLHMPVTGLLKAVAIVIVTYLLFHDTHKPSVSAEVKQPMTHDERVLILVLLVSVGLWASDFLHNISPAWIAFGAALMCLLPAVGLVPISAFNREFNFSSMFYVAGIIGMGAVVAKSGLGEVLSRMFLDYVGFLPGREGYNFAAMVGLSTVLGMVTTDCGVPAVLSPLAGDIATITGWPLLTVLMTQVIGYSTVILPYQSAPLVLAMHLGRVRTGAGIRLIVAMAVVTLILLTPINYFWWRFLGYFG